MLQHYCLQERRLKGDVVGDKMSILVVLVGNLGLRGREIRD